MKFIPKYITTDILAEYGEHLTHEAYNEMVKLNSSQGDYNSQVLNQLFNTDEGIQIPYLDKKIKEVTDDQAAINEDMEQVVADMAALAGSLSKYSTIIETRRMIQYATQDFVKTNKIKAGENVEVEVDALNNVIISATGGGDVTKDYVDEQDATTLQFAKGYTDTKISQIPIPVVPTDISAFNNDVGYITGYTETDPIFSASAAAGITSQDITDWGNKSDFSGNYADLNGKPDLSVYVDKTSTQAISGSKLFTTIPQTNQQASENHHIINKKYFDEHIPTVPTNISAFNNDSGYITGYTETDPVFSASAAAGITSTDITNWNTASHLAGLKDGSVSGSLRGLNTTQEVDDPLDPDYYIMGSNAMAIGTSTQATGNSSIAAGPGGAVASGTGAVAIGYGSTASGSGAFALGSGALASGNESFALGTGATASGSSSLALGSGATAGGTGGTMVVGSSSSTSANSFSSVVLGLSSSVTGSSQGCAAIGYQATATGYGTTAFNQGNASGNYTHAEGSGTASNSYSHAEGQATVANGANAHAEGMYTEAGNMQHAEGFYNLVEALPIIHMVGNGNSGARSNAYTLDQLGNGWFAGDVYVGSTSGTHKDTGSVKLAKETQLLPSITDAHWTDAAREFIFANKAVGTYLVHNGSTTPQSDITYRSNMSFRASTATSSRVSVTAQWGIIYIMKAYNDAATDEVFGYALFANGQTDGTMEFKLQSITRLSSGYRVSFNNMMITNNNSPIKKMIRLYSSSSTYDVDDLVLNTDGWFYRCTTAITTPEAFNYSHWTNFDGYGIDKYIKELIASASAELLRSDVIAPAYDDTATYAVGDYVMYNGGLYECNTAITVAEAWDSTHWTSTTLATLLGNIATALGGI